MAIDGLSNSYKFQQYLWKKNASHWDGLKGMLK